MEWRLNGILMGVLHVEATLRGYATPGKLPMDYNVVNVKKALKEYKTAVAQLRVAKTAVGKLPSLLKSASARFHRAEQALRYGGRFNR